jgi:ribonuclease HI
MGLGAVLRDSQGNLVAAKCVSRLGRLAPAAAEALAAMLAIKLCREVGCLRVQFEGDAKGVIDAVNSPEVNNSWMGQAIQDIRVELQPLADWKFTFVKREGNIAAHNLAKYALTNCISDSLIASILCLLIVSKRL